MSLAPTPTLDMSKASPFHGVGGSLPGIRHDQSSYTAGYGYGYGGPLVVTLARFDEVSCLVWTELVASEGFGLCRCLLRNAVYCVCSGL
jgi:hypothetical protein